MLTSIQIECSLKRRCNEASHRNSECTYKFSVQNSPLFCQVCECITMEMPVFGLTCQFYCNKLSHPSRCMFHLPKRFLDFDGDLHSFLFGFGWGLCAFLQGPLMFTSHVSPVCKPGVLKLTCMSPTWLRRAPRSRAVCWNCTSFTRLSLTVWPYGSLTPQPVSTACIY